MKRLIMAVSIVLTISFVLSSAATSTEQAREWIATYTGPGDTIIGAQAFPKLMDREKSDGLMGVAVVGSDGELAEQGCLIDLSTEGKIDRKTCYGGERNDSITDVIPAEEEGFYLSGYTNATTNSGSGRSWIAQVDYRGDVKWSRLFGPRWEETDDTGLTSNYKLVSLMRAPEGGIFAAGYFVTGIPGKPPPKTFNPSDMEMKGWLVKISSSGEVIWQKSYGGKDLGGFTSARKVQEGGFVLAGTTFSLGLKGPEGPTDLWIIKTDNSGRIEWQYRFDKKLGGVPDSSLGVNAVPVEDGYIVASVVRYGEEDNTWITKLGPSGKVEWSRTYGEKTTRSTFPMVRALPGGGYFASVMTFLGEKESGNTWFLRLDERGGIEWQREFGGSGYDGLLGFQATEYGYSIFGTTGSLGSKWKGIIANYPGFGPPTMPKYPALEIRTTSADSQRASLERIGISSEFRPENIPVSPFDLEIHQVKLDQQYLREPRD